MGNAIEQVVGDAKAGRLPSSAVLVALAQAEVIVPLAANETDGPEQSLRVFEADGFAYGALFTSREQMTRAGLSGRHAVLTGRQLAAIWPDELRAAVNPGSAELGITLSAEDVRRLAAAEPLTAGQDMYVGAPADPVPDRVSQAVAESVRSTPDVDTAYVFQMADEAQGSRLVVGVVVTDGADPTVAMPDIVAKIQARLRTGEVLDVLELNSALRATVAEFVEPCA